MTQISGTQFAPQPTPLTADEKLRAETTFAPLVAEALVTRGWFRITADTAERVELFQQVGRRVGEIFGRPVVSYVDGEQILIAFEPAEPAALAQP